MFRSPMSVALTFTPIALPLFEMFQGDVPADQTLDEVFEPDDELPWHEAFPSFVDCDCRFMEPDPSPSLHEPTCRTRRGFGPVEDAL